LLNNLKTKVIYFLKIRNINKLLINTNKGTNIFKMFIYNK